MKILYVFADAPHEMNCSQWNCFYPTDAINKTKEHTASYMYIGDFIKSLGDENLQKTCMESDIIIIERNFFQDTLTAMNFYWVRGKILAGIWDDGYNVMHPKNVSYPFWTHGEMRFKDERGEEHVHYMIPKPLTQMRYGLHMLKGAQVVSDYLVESWKDYVDCYKIHNHLVIERYMDVQPLHPHEKDIWIGWTGSLSHVDSFESSGLLRAYRKIVKKYPNVKILISGDKRIYDNLDVPVTRKMFSGFVPIEQYPSLIKSLDICTIPLAGEYDKCRSQIKPLECLALKVPFLATNYPNYNHLQEYGTFTENGWENWENALSDMIENLPKYQEKAIEIGYPFALTQNIDLHVQERIDLYQKLIDKPYRY